MSSDEIALCADQNGAHKQFIDAVTRQLTRPPGAAGRASPEREASVRAAVVRLLGAAAAGAGTAPFDVAVNALDADQEFLSSVFQNLDLLGVDDRVGIGVAVLVGEALSGQ